jgi:hypothetical protein
MRILSTAQKRVSDILAPPLFANSGQKDSSVFCDLSQKNGIIYLNLHLHSWPTEWPPLVDEVSANFCGYEVLRGQHNGSVRPYFLFSRPEPLFSLSSNSSVVLTRLSGLRSRPTTSQRIW